MSIELGQGDTSKDWIFFFENANFDQDVIMYDNEFITDVIGSRKVSTILKYKAAHTTGAKFEQVGRSFHEKVGLVTQRNLAIILKIRSKLTPFFFGILEDSDLPPIIGTEIREQYPECFMDFNLTDDGNVYVTMIKVLNRRAKEK